MKGIALDPPEPLSDATRRWFAEELQRVKLDAMKELAYGASHEINNPLANIALRAQTLLKREDEPSKRKALEAMHRAAMRAHEMISDLMLFARPPALEKQAIDLRDVIDSVANEARPRAEADGIQLVVASVDRPVEVQADSDQLVVAIRAVVENALDALGSMDPSGQGSCITINASREPDMAVVSVVDNGPGIPAAVRPHVFDPFFSGREAGRGLGFGLPKCWRIVTQHDGQVALDCPPEGGVSVTLRLPY